MRLSAAEGVEVDLDDINARTEAWEGVRIGMKVGFITADNIMPEEVQAVRDFFASTPIVAAGSQPGEAIPVIALANLVEGRDWCFATARNGTFGVFSLDEPSRSFLQGAVIHMWIEDPDSRMFRRDDYTDLGDYQTDALEAMQVAV